MGIVEDKVVLPPWATKLAEKLRVRISANGSSQGYRADRPKGLLHCSSRGEVIFLIATRQNEWHEGTYLTLGDENRFKMWIRPLALLRAIVWASRA